VAVIGAAIAVLVTAAVLTVHYVERSAQVGDPPSRHSLYTLPIAPASYIGLYPPGVPGSYAAAAAFTRSTGITPNVITYYSGWLEPFQARFADIVAKHGAVPLVQIDPTDISLTSIADGQYDGYLIAYAEAIRNYQHSIILSFGHEMNGHWYSWGYRHASPKSFVAAWRHIVTLFRRLGARNVTWLWTINVIHAQHNVASPGPWWPGSSYVNWVGIDGYYYNSSLTFASLFGPTITAVRSLTKDPIFIAETAAAPSAGQPAKIADLFASIRADGILGFVWFDSRHIEDWRISSPAAIAAFRLAAKAYRKLALGAGASTAT
jgi:mannan endo-1,4-beta-mannosidase